MVRRLFLSLLVLSGSTFVACGQERQTNRLFEEWDNRNDPKYFSLDLDYKFDRLPLQGESEKQAWPDSYWPSYRGGLAARWLTQDTDAFSYGSPTADEALIMSQDELAKLSPAEKYDLYIGNYDYDFVTYERQRTHPDDEQWFGLCHGWAPAAINFEEPEPIVATSVDGIQIPFGSSDIKGLLTFVQQFQRRSDATQFLGGRCDEDISLDPDEGASAQCRDINAGTFHVIVTNLLGLQKVGFVADITRDIEVWNQPIHGFRSEVVDVSSAVYDNAAPGTVSIVTIATTLEYTIESRASWDSFGTPDPFPYNARRDLSYTVELDANGMILGGEWVLGERPDFLWRQATPEFGGYFEQLRVLYEQAIGFP